MRTYNNINEIHSTSTLMGDDVPVGDDDHMRQCLLYGVNLATGRD